MEGLAGLRFKLMSHFLKVLNTPSSQDYRMNAEYEKLLDCLSKVLTMDHERNNFSACLDLLPPNLVSFKTRLASAIDLNRQSQATDRFSQQRSRWNNDQIKVLIAIREIVRRRYNAVYLLLGVVAHWTYTLVQRQRSQLDSTHPNPTGNFSNRNALSPIKAENDLEKERACGDFKWESR